MRVLRNKHNRKTLNLFRIVYDVRPPYKVLVDGTFVVQGVKMKADFEALMPKIMMDTVYLHTTECVMRELKALGPEFAEVVAAASRISMIRCSHKHGHSRDMDASTCLAALLGPTNPTHFCVASQDPSLRDAVRKVPGTPIILFNQNVLVLEPPSKTSKTDTASKEVAKSVLSKEERKAVATAIAAAKGLPAPATGGASTAAAGAASAGGAAVGGSSTAAVSGVKRKRKGPAAPNPLSVKKKAKAVAAAGTAAGAGAGGGEGAGSRKLKAVGGAGTADAGADSGDDHDDGGGDHDDDAGSVAGTAATGGASVTGKRVRRGGRRHKAKRARLDEDGGSGSDGEGGGRGGGGDGDDGDE